MTNGSKISAQFFQRKVGTGSKRHDFVGELLMIFSTFFSETSLKRDRLGVVHMGGMTVVEETVSMSQVLLIFYKVYKPSVPIVECTIMYSSS